VYLHSQCNKIKTNRQYVHIEKVKINTILCQKCAHRIWDISILGSHIVYVRRHVGTAILDVVCHRIVPVAMQCRSTWQHAHWHRWLSVRRQVAKSQDYGEDYSTQSGVKLKLKSAWRIVTLATVDPATTALHRPLSNWPHGQSLSMDWSESTTRWPHGPTSYPCQLAGHHIQTYDLGFIKSRVNYAL